MFGFFRGPILFSGTKDKMKISQGYNNISKKFFIYITDKKTKVTCRIDMDEEHYQNFHGMGNYTYKQTKQDEGEFEE